MKTRKKRAARFHSQSEAPQSPTGNQEEAQERFLPLIVLQPRVARLFTYDSLDSLVFRTKFHAPMTAKKVFTNEGGEIGAPPLKRCYFTGIGSPSVKMVADRHRQALAKSLLGMSTSMTLNDLEPLK